MCSCLAIRSAQPEVECATVHCHAYEKIKHSHHNHRVFLISKEIAFGLFYSSVTDPVANRKLFGKLWFLCRELYVQSMYLYNPNELSAFSF